MTSKELLYVEDALGHEKIMQKTCSNFVNQLQDPELKGLVQDICTKHQDSFKRFYNLLG